MNRWAAGEETNMILDFTWEKMGRREKEGERDAGKGRRDVKGGREGGR